MKCKNSAKNPAKNIRCLPHSRGNLTVGMVLSNNTKKISPVVYRLNGHGVVLQMGFLLL